MTREQQSLRSNDLEGRLLRLHHSAASNISHSVAQHAARLGPVLQLDADIAVWEAALAGRPEQPVLATARRELGFTVYSAASGLYLQAFSTLRLFLELSFASVAFSVDDLRRRQWLANDSSFSWGAAIDPDTGLFSPQYLKAYKPEALVEAPTYRELATKTYGHCSQFVHGKMIFIESIPATLTYSEVALREWADMARSAARAVMFLLYCRYSTELIESDSGELALTLAHNLGHLKSVRRLVGMPVDEEPADGGR